MGTLGWVDIALLSLLAISVIVGLLRGFLFEVLSLLGWVAAYFAAQWLGPMLAQHLPVGRPGSPVNLAAAFCLVFIGVLIGWAIAARLIRMVVNATALSVPDRMLGAGFGALRAIVLMLAIATVVAMTPAVRSQAWQGSRGAHWLHAMLQGLKPVLPHRMAQHLPD
jgi:membrane protein required for colicin V production